MSYENLYTPQEILTLRAQSERLGDTSVEYHHQHQHQHQHVSEPDPYFYRSQYSPEFGERSFDSPVTPWLLGSPREEFMDEEGSVDHSSPVQMFPQDLSSSPVQISPLAPQGSWVRYGSDEYSQNFNHGQYSQYGGESLQGSYFSPPRILGNNTNPGYPSPSFQSDGLSTATICGTPGSNHNNHSGHTGITEEKENQSFAPDQNQNQSSDDRNNLMPSSPQSRRYRCPVRGCGQQFKRRAELDRHKESLHQPSPGHLCPIQGCNRSLPEKGFSRKDNLRQHLKLKHDVKFPKGRRSRRV